MKRHLSQRGSKWQLYLSTGVGESTQTHSLILSAPLKSHQYVKMIPFLSWSVSTHSPHLTVIFPPLVCSQGISSREERDDLVRSSSHTPSNKAQILAMPQFGLRDNLIRCELLKNEDLYTYREHFRYVPLYCLLGVFLIICFAHFHAYSCDCGIMTHRNTINFVLSNITFLHISYIFNINSINNVLILWVGRHTLFNLQKDD